MAAADLRACDAFDVRDRLHEIAVPVLLVSAEDDHITPPVHATFLEERLGQARRLSVPGAGHLVAWEKPELVNEAVCVSPRD